jgi:dolichol-phosphate mannosyltransferase
MRNVAPNQFSPGWLSLLIAILGVGAMNLFILGIIGEYVGQLFEQAQGRPRYVVDYTK